MKFNLSKILVTILSVTLISSCGTSVMGGKSKKKTNVPVAPQVTSNRTNVSVNRMPAPLNPSNNFSRDISGTNKVTWNRGSANSKYIAITFDDGPVASNTSRLLDMLRRRNIKATFYVIGERVQNNQALTRRIAAEGHEIGNHTWSHGNLTQMSDSKVRWELDKTRDAVVAAAGVKPRTMRPPYGALRQDQRSWIFREYGYPTIMWDVDPQDWKKPGAAVVSNRILSGTKNGSIILLHDLHSASVDAVPATVDGLLRRGYKFVTVSQLIALTNSGQ